jgi:anti-anti-sigma regulatory factor
MSKKCLSAGVRNCGLTLNMLYYKDMEDKARVFAGWVNNNSMIKISGHATWQISAALRNHINAHLQKHLESKHLIFDLTRCTFLDSTTIGLISHLAVKYLQVNQRQATLLYSVEKVKEILELMNCHRIITLIRSDAEDPTKLEAIPELQGQAALDKAELRQCVLLAHQALVELNEKNLGEFDQVILDLKKPPKTN